MPGLSEQKTNNEWLAKLAGELEKMKGQGSEAIKKLWEEGKTKVLEALREWWRTKGEAIHAAVNEHGAEAVGRGFLGPLGQLLPF